MSEHLTDPTIWLLWASVDGDPEHLPVTVCAVCATLVVDAERHRAHHAEAGR